MGIAIRTVDAAGDPSVEDDFLDLPVAVYQGDDYCRPRPRETARSLLHREVFATSQRAFVAYRDDRATARVVARISAAMKSADNTPVGMLGMFESTDDAAVCTELVTAAVTWLQAQGAGLVVAPMDGDTWHSYRCNTGPYDTPPFLMEPYNPPYYPKLWIGCGFRSIESYYSKRVADVTEVIPVLQKFRHRAASHGYVFRPLRLSAYEADLKIIYDLSCDIFADNFLYSEIAEPDFLALYAGLEKVVQPALIQFALTADGTPVGFVFAIPDYRSASRQPDTVNIKTLGVAAAHRHTGLALALMHTVYEQIAAMGIAKANLCLIREGNPSGRMDGGKGVRLRSYELYQYQGNSR